MGLYFSSEDYRKKALDDAQTPPPLENEHSVEDAFFLLVNGEPRENLANLCALIKKYYEKSNNVQNIDLSMDEAYELLQGNSIDGKVSLDERTKKIILRIAYYCIENLKRPLGIKTIKGTHINTSDWLSHSLLEGKLAGQLAKRKGLNEEVAQKYGMLHDYGRKQVHCFEHVIKGYEALIDKGWSAEALGCLTHSFLRGGRCSNNEQAEEGFYVDSDGNPHWLEGSEKDDITIFLEKYKYTKYDDILNIADLMATSHGIVSPAERIADIATRRKAFDSRNRSFFLAELTNCLVENISELGGKIPKEIQVPIKASEGVSLKQITQSFELISRTFFDLYQNNHEMKYSEELDNR